MNIRRLLRKREVVGTGLSLASVALILALHYTSPLKSLALHDLLRRFLYLPVITAAITGGVRGALLTAAVAAASYIPHLSQLAAAGDRVLDHVPELVLLPVIGLLVGGFAESSRRARALAAEKGRLAALGEVATVLMAQAEGPLASIQGQTETLRFLANCMHNGAVGFAAEIIQKELVRTRRFLLDLRSLERPAERRATEVNLPALVAGVVREIAATPGAGSRLALGEVPERVVVVTDRGVLAYALRSLLLGLLQAVPEPAPIRVRVLKQDAGVAIEAAVVSTAEELPGLERRLCRVFGGGADEYNLDRALWIHLFTSEGASVSFPRASERESVVRVAFLRRDRPAPRLRAKTLAAACLFCAVAGVGALADATAVDAQIVPAASPEDTTGMALVQWAYDAWTVPWVQVRGASRALAPESHATLMVLVCESSNLERDRQARHLSAEECEHRMATIRADQDSALIFRLDLHVFDGPALVELVRLGRTVRFRLEDDRGRSWDSPSVARGPVLESATALKLKRNYQPPWMRGSEHLLSHRYGVSGGRSMSLAEHRIRFPRRDSRTGQLLLAAETQWLRLTMSYGNSEWVATWVFRREQGSRE